MINVMCERQETGELWNVVALGDITINRSKNEPASLSAVFLRDAMTVENGDIIAVQEDGPGGNNLFYGYVRETAKEMDEVSVTAYDQLFNLKNNRETKKYGDKKASELITQIAEEKGLFTSDIEDTEYLIPEVVADNTALLDLVLEALNETFQVTGKRFYVNDEFRNIKVAELESGKIPIEYFEINTNNAESYSYGEDATGVVNETLIKSNDSNNDANIFQIRNEESIKRYGTFTYSATVKDGENPEAVAKQVLAERSPIPCKMSCSVYGCPGDLYPGRLVHVDFYSSRYEYIKGYFLVESASFKLSGGTGTTDLDLTLYEMEGFDG